VTSRSALQLSVCIFCRNDACCPTKHTVLKAMLCSDVGFLTQCQRPATYGISGAMLDERCTKADLLQ
jgi:hypothetical protein